MTEPKLWLPHGPIPEVVQDDEGYVTVRVDRTMPIGQHSVPRIRPEDLLLSMARMSRDGKTREQIRKELEIHFYVDPNTGVRHYVDDATFDRALAKGRALLQLRIRQGLEPEETVFDVLVPDGGDDE